MILSWKGIRVSVATIPKTGTQSIKHIFSELGWNRSPNGGQHEPNHPSVPSDVDYILTAKREEEAWLRSFYQNINAPIGCEPIDRLFDLDRTTLETFRADYREKLPGYFNQLLEIYAPPGAVIIRTEHLADDMADFLSTVQRRVIRAMPRKNVTEPI
jgi:hypothetical protein